VEFNGNQETEIAVTVDMTKDGEVSDLRNRPQQPCCILQLLKFSQNEN
jgi:hypothetical protein